MNIDLASIRADATEQAKQKKYAWISPTIVMTMVGEIEQLTREVAGERDQRDRLAEALRRKDEVMGVLFARLNKAGVDCSDLIP